MKLRDLKFHLRIQFELPLKDSYSPMATLCHLENGNLPLLHIQCLYRNTFNTLAHEGLKKYL